jgi:hypothetical protein
VICDDILLMRPSGDALSRGPETVIVPSGFVPDLVGDGARSARVMVTSPDCYYFWAPRFLIDFS